MASLPIVAASVRAQIGARIERAYNAGESISAGEPVYLGSNDNLWRRASSATAAEANAGGIALNGAYTGQPLAVQTGGNINLGNVLERGGLYVVGATAGKIAPAEDATGGEVLTSLGIAVSPTDLQLAVLPVQAAWGVAAPAMHTDGLIAEWRFAEGSGNSVNDEVGSADIDLNLPASPNVTWTTTGVRTNAGLVQTPSISNARTIALLYKVTRGENAGFVISGGASSGAGLIPDGATNNTYHTGLNGIRPLRARVTSVTQAGYIHNRGGWVLAFMEMTSAFATAFGLGGRHSTTTSRCATCDIAWCGVWNDQLTDAERLTVYDAVRALYAKPRGIYLDYRDCPVVADAVAVWGQSNADGRALISELTIGEQAQTYAKSYILSADGAPRPTPPAALLDLGVNQTVNSPATQFGPETFLANAHEAGPVRALHVAKTAEGGTYLATSSAFGGSGTSTWNAGEPATSSLYHSALTDAYDLEQSMLSAGIGCKWRALFFMQGEQDATSTTYSATYQANLAALIADVRTYLTPTLPIVVGRIRDQDPAMDATAAAQVRAAQAAVVAATTGASLIDTDAFSLNADSVHYGAAGMRSLGQAFYAAVFG
jgi:hypothetical protein